MKPFDMTKPSAIAEIPQGSSMHEKPNADPVHWEVDADLKEYFAYNVPPQNLDDDFEKSMRWFGRKNPVKRCIQRSYFYREMTNGEQRNRDWLIYSPSTGKVYCYVCKVYQPSFQNTCTSSECDKQFQSGFDDWKNAGARLALHERSRSHLAAVCRLMEVRESTRIDRELLKQMTIEKQYWINVLERVVAVIMFLAERGLAFRGDSEVFGSPHNGNYLGCMELLSKFDPFSLRTYSQSWKPWKRTRFVHVFHYL